MFRAKQRCLVHTILSRLPLNYEIKTYAIVLHIHEKGTLKGKSFILLDRKFLKVKTVISLGGSILPSKFRDLSTVLISILLHHLE